MLNRSARLGSARLGSARLGSARLGSARLGSARTFHFIRLGSVSLRFIRLRFTTLGSARAFRSAPLHYNNIIVMKLFLFKKRVRHSHQKASFRPYRFHHAASERSFHHALPCVSCQRSETETETSYRSSWQSSGPA